MGQSTIQRLDLSTEDLEHGRLLQVLAVTALLSTLLLVVVGSYVRVSGNGLGCPDWPLCYGRAVPPFQYSAWVEFSHRLLGGVVSLQIVAIAWLAWTRARGRVWIRRIALATVAVLVIQVSLGGLHVLNELPHWTGLVHTGVAMAVVGLLAALVAVTQPGLSRLSQLAPELFAETSVRRWVIVGAVATYLLLLTGSLVTRTGSSLACPSFPHCGIAEVGDQLRPYVTVQLIHRFSAFTVAGSIVAVLVYLLRYGRERVILRRFSLGLCLLLLIQFGLGISNVLLALPIWSRVLHLGVGASIWSIMVILAVALNRTVASDR